VTRLLIVDDSALMRRLLVGLFEAVGGFEVSVARDGGEALNLLHAVRPDVVTLDIHMSGMDGLACLDRIMLERPTPVVMFSSLTEDGAAETVEALALGAVDYALKPSGAVSLKVDAFGPVLIDKVLRASKARLSGSHRLAERVRLRAGVSERARPEPASVMLLKPKREERGETLVRPLAPGGERLVLVGASTGGPPALDALLTPLPAGFPWPIVVAQHMPASFTAALAARLDRICALDVVEVVRPTRLLAGHVYVGRGDADVIVSRRGGELVALPAPSGAEYRWHPSVDRLVDSAMLALAPERLVGVLLTGMGADGAAAMTRLHLAGGRTIAEAEATAIVWGMPGELVRANGAEFVAPLPEIAGCLAALADTP
jgi:two-component system chemotaxis response regulator CheB